MSSKMDKIFSPIKGRVIEYIDYLGITKEYFYETTGLHASNFKGKGGLSELGGDKIAKILTVFNKLSSKWLLTGEGPIEDDAETAPNHDNLQPGPCQQCEQRERTIISQEKTIRLLEEKIDSIQREKRQNKSADGGIRQTG